MFIDQMAGGTFGMKIRFNFFLGTTFKSLHCPKWKILPLQIYRLLSTGLPESDIATPSNWSFSRDMSFLFFGG